MKKKILLMVVAICLSVVVAGFASAAPPSFEGSVDITPDNPTINVGENVTLTAIWGTNRGVTWYKWEVADISQGDVELPDTDGTGGYRNMTYSGVAPGEYEVCFYVWHHQQSDRYADDCVTITVIDQVCTWEGETAWADGEPYNVRGNWATYTPYISGSFVTLYAGQTMEAGTVEFSEPVNGEVAIRIEPNEGWRFSDSAENVKIQDYDIAPSGNPSPGQFESKGYATENYFTISVPENSFYGVHVDVERCVTEQ
jgi:hypothetical protein